jgi:hypothetical protein
MTITIPVDNLDVSPVVAAAGVPVVVPSPSVPRAGLAAVAGASGPGVRVIPVAPEADGDEPWVVAGLVFRGAPCGTVPAVSTKCDENVVVPSIGLYDTVQGTVSGFSVLVDCDTFNATVDGEFERVAQDRLRVLQWNAFARELWSGTVAQADGLTEGWLSDGTAVDVTSGLPESAGGGTTVSLVTAAGLLAGAGGACSPGSELVWHVPSRAVDALNAQNLLVSTGVQGQWRTASGLLVVGDAGYTGDGFASPGTATEFSTYLTTQVSAVFSQVAVAAQDTPYNNTKQRAASFAFAFGWLCCHFTARVSLCVDPCAGVAPAECEPSTTTEIEERCADGVRQERYRVVTVGCDGVPIFGVWSAWVATGADCAGCETC